MEKIKLLPFEEIFIKNNFTNLNKIVNKDNIFVSGVNDILIALSLENGIDVGVYSEIYDAGVLRNSNLKRYFKLFYKEKKLKNIIENELRKKYNKIFFICTTPEEILFAKNNGLIVLAMPAKKYSKEELIKFNPDYILEDFDDIELFLKRISQ